MRYALRAQLTYLVEEESTGRREQQPDFLMLQVMRVGALGTQTSFASFLVIESKLKRSHLKQARYNVFRYKQSFQWQVRHMFLARDPHLRTTTTETCRGMMQIFDVHTCISCFRHGII